jgi:hypothetical protein
MDSEIFDQLIALYDITCPSFTRLLDPHTTNEQSHVVTFDHNNYRNFGHVCNVFGNNVIQIFKRDENILIKSDNVDNECVINTYLKVVDVFVTIMYNTMVRRIIGDIEYNIDEQVIADIHSSIYDYISKRNMHCDTLINIVKKTIVKNVLTFYDLDNGILKNIYNNTHCYNKIPWNGPVIINGYIRNARNLIISSRTNSGDHQKNAINIMFRIWFGIKIDEFIYQHSICHFFENIYDRCRYSNTISPTRDRVKIHIRNMDISTMYNNLNTHSYKYANIWSNNTVKSIIDNHDKYLENEQFLKTYIAKSASIYNLAYKCILWPLLLIAVWTFITIFINKYISKSTSGHLYTNNYTTATNISNSYYTNNSITDNDIYICNPEGLFVTTLFYNALLIIITIKTYVTHRHMSSNITEDYETYNAKKLIKHIISIMALTSTTALNICRQHYLDNVYRTCNYTDIHISNACILTYSIFFIAYFINDRYLSIYATYIKYGLNCCNCWLRCTCRAQLINS